MRANTGVPVGTRHCNGVGTNLTCGCEWTGEQRLVTWDPGGEPAGEEIVKTKGPVKANKNNVAGTRNKTRNLHTTLVTKKMYTSVELNQ